MLIQKNKKQKKVNPAKADKIICKKNAKSYQQQQHRARKNEWMKKICIQKSSFITDILAIFLQRNHARTY